MGFFDFLSKKGAGDSVSLNSGYDIISQPYNLTAIALPPIRGGLPVTGNGPNTLEDLKRAARKRSEAQLLARTTIEPSAPPPMVPRVRSKSFGRPNTAPSIAGAPASGQRPKSAGRNANRPSFVPKKSTPGPPYLVGVSGPDDDKPEYTPTSSAPPVPPIASQFMKRDSPSLSSRPATSTSGKKGPGSYAGSVMSGRSAGAGTVSTGMGIGGNAGYIDILDAKGVTPADFKARLRATGARDYGEDVAERNLGVNGVNLNSPAVVAFYALTGGGPLAYKSDGSAVDVHGNRYAAGKIPTNLATTVEGKGRDELSALANKKIRTPSFPERTTSLQPQPRRGVISATPGDLANSEAKSILENDDSGPRRRISLHGGPISAASSNGKLRPLSMHPSMSSHGHDPAGAPDVPFTRPITSPGQIEPSTDDVLRSQVKIPKLKIQKRTEAAPPIASPPIISPPSKNAKPRSSKSIPLMVAAQSTHEVGQHGNPTTRDRSASASRRERKQKMEEFDQFDYEVSPVGEPRGVPRGVPVSRFSTTSVASTDLQQKQKVRGHENSRSRVEDGSQVRPQASHPRKRSIGAASMRSRPRLDDIDELVPGRRDQWRNESVSSVAQSSAVTASSHPSSKHSRHTADTSLDLGYSMPAAMQQAKLPGIIEKSHVRGKGSNTTLNSVRVSHSYKTQRAKVPGSLSRSVDEEGYRTSTDASDFESFIETRGPPRREDESLLFNDSGYGQSGGGLPGLFDNLTMGEITSSPWTPAHDAPHPYKSSSRIRAPTSAPRLPEAKISSRKIVPPIFPALEYDEGETSSSLTASESDADLRSRTDSINTADLSSILSGDGRYDPDEEALEERLDAHLAVRLRKEMKRRERDLTRRETILAKASRQAYDQGHVADNEA